MTSQDKVVSAIFVVVPMDTQSILGLKTCEQLGMVKRVHLINRDKMVPSHQLAKKYADVLKGIGCLPVTYSIKLAGNVKPVVSPTCKVPLALQQRLKTKLQKLVEQRVITKVTIPTEWVNPLVIVEKKSGDLRLCMDPKVLNKYIQREYEYIPTRQELVSDLNGAAVFTKLDVSSAFYQIPICEKSSRLCTFNTPFGRYRFLRLPFGIKSATEVMHRTVTQLLEGLEGVKSILDDIVIWGKNTAEHDKHLQNVLEIAKKNNLKFNLDKYKFATSSILFFGEKLSKEGIHPDPSKIEAITNMKTPQCKNDLQRALGMLNFLAQYVPNVSDKTEHMRSLLWKDVHWQWGPEHVAELNKLKAILTSAPVLKYFDPNKETKISADASQCSLGAVLLQKHKDNWCTVAYAARSLTETETNYSQIEKKTLGLVFGCEKFYHFVYGRNFHIATDHKPLISIASKPLSQTPPRIQRLMLRLQAYDYSLSYTQGTHLLVADALSRSCPHDPAEHSSTEEDVKIHVDSVISTLPVTEAKWQHIAHESAKDATITAVMDKVKHEWEAAKPIRPFYDFREELSVHDGVLLKGLRIVIPDSMKGEMVEKVHEGHLGIEKCRRRARSAMYWVNMNRDIELAVKRCSICARYSNKQQKEPLLPHDKPNQPWVKVGTDLFTLQGKNYVAVVDYHSNYPEIASLANTSSNQVIVQLKGIFAQLGIPEIVMSDNRPQF